MPMKRMTAEECEARAEAYSEAASHLEGDWTDERVERIQGNILAEKLFKMADRWSGESSIRREEQKREEPTDAKRTD